LLEEYDVGAAQLEGDLEKLLAELAENGLVAAQ
jgi:hypothetical protein